MHFEYSSYDRHPTLESEYDFSLFKSFCEEGLSLNKFVLTRGVDEQVIRELYKYNNWDLRRSAWSSYHATALTNQVEEAKDLIYSETATTVAKGLKMFRIAALDLSGELLEIAMGHKLASNVQLKALIKSLEIAGVGIEPENVQASVNISAEIVDAVKSMDIESRRRLAERVQNINMITYEKAKTNNTNTNYKEEE